MYSFVYSVERILIRRIQYESNGVLTTETKYDVIEELESGVNAIELTEIHGVGKATITDTKKQKHDIENYPKNVDSYDARNGGKKF